MNIFNAITADNDNGKPDAKKEKPAATVSEFKCSCGKALIRRKGTSKAGKSYDFYGCSGFKEGCKNTCRVKEDGSPDYERSKNGQQ